MFMMFVVWIGFWKDKFKDNYCGHIISIFDAQETYFVPIYIIEGLFLFKFIVFKIITYTLRIKYLSSSTK